jgi:hypothetical protein
MVRHQTSPVTAAHIEGIPVVGRLASAESRAELPEQIAGYACRGECRLLPRRLDVTMIRRRPVWFVSGTLVLVLF